MENSILYLYYTDYLYSNRDLCRFSLLKLGKEYLNQSERMEKDFPGYYLNKEMLIVPHAETKKINFNLLIDTLKRPYTCDEDF